MIEMTWLENIKSCRGTGDRQFVLWVSPISWHPVLAQNHIYWDRYSSVIATNDHLLNICYWCPATVIFYQLGHDRFEGVKPLAVIFPESGGWSSGTLALKSSSVWCSARLFIYTSLEQPLFGIRGDKKCLIKWNSINQQNNLAWKSWHRALILIERLATHLYDVLEEILNNSKKVPINIKIMKQK